MKKYKIRHLPCNVLDFNADRHRFSFEVNGKRGEAWCIGKCDIHFTVGLCADDEVNISRKVWRKIDKDEMKWAYPPEAYSIADRYCETEFR